ncbi:hypothetical protein LTR66_009705 [Elasticomyces elasticus]|nr:hypothetical protein LTR66_009705 [Elasticomyces elasticus]
MSVSPTYHPTPLSDRSNTQCSPSSTNILLQNKASKRGLFSNLDSSESIPSEHDSLVDAWRWHLSERSNPENDDSVSSTNGTLTRKVTYSFSDIIDALPTFLNNPQGTQLTTIIEQRSYTTLRTTRSSTRVQQVSPDKRIASLSLDELAFHKLHKRPRIPELSPISSEGTDAIGERPFTLQPRSPPFQPPERVKTPDGYPRWPGDLAAPPPRPQPRYTSSRAALIDFLHCRATASQVSPTVASTVSRRFGYQQDTPRRVGRAYWRPPNSGHMTPGFADEHPFQHAPVASPVSRLPQNVPPVSSVPRGRSGQGQVSSARNALGAINSNAVPVAPARALSACTRRVVSMPSRGSSRHSSGESHYQTPREMNSPELDTAYPTGTARTIDLIARFPSPSKGNTGLLTRPAVLSPIVFPRALSPPILPSLSNVDISLTSPNGPTADLSGQVTDSQGHTRELSEHTSPVPVSPSSPTKRVEHCSTRTVIAPSSRQSPEHQTPDILRGGGSEARAANDTGPPKHARRLSVFPPEYTAAACNVTGHIDANSSTNRSPRESSDDSSNTNIRGEATARYTSSGTPIYRPDTSSIRSFDRQTGDTHDRAPSNLTPAGTPLVTALTELPHLTRQVSAGNNAARRRDSKFADILLPSDPTIGIGRASITGAEIWPVGARPFARAARCSHVVRSSSADSKRGLSGRAGDVGEACWRCRIGERFDRGMRRIAQVCFCRRFEKEEDDEDGEEEEGGDDVGMLEPVRRIEMAGAVSC